MRILKARITMSCEITEQEWQKLIADSEGNDIEDLPYHLVQNFMLTADVDRSSSYIPFMWLYEAERVD